MENKETNKKILGNHLLNQIFFDKYKLVKKLGEGSFGMIFKAESRSGNYAFKFEKKRPNKRSLLKNESEVMIYLKGKGIPLIESYIEDDNYNIMIMQLLGKSLEGILKESDNKKYSLKTVCLLALEIIPILKFIHDKHIIHRDIKPDNFAIGYDDPCQIYILDFGLAKKYRSSRTLKHNPLIKHARLTGTARYASINALKGYEQSRRDDLESFGYVLAYLLRGSLPWQGITAKTKEEKYAKILNKKINIPIEKILKNEPQEFINYIKYTKILRYEQDPDYEYLIGLFKNIFNKVLKEEIDYKYDWVDNKDIEIHKKLNDGSFNNNNNDDTSMINNINSLTNGNSKNNISAKEDNNNKEQKPKKQKNYYDEVIDEFLLDKKEKEFKRDKENEIEEENISKNHHKEKSKEKSKEKRHGQCCLII